jgi:hypothetical protein
MIGPVVASAIWGVFGESFRHPLIGWLGKFFQFHYRLMRRCFPEA